MTINDGRRRRSRGTAGSPPPQGTRPPAEPSTPSPEWELMGLGAMVAIFRKMTTDERLSALDYLGSRYGHRVSPDPSCDRCRSGILCGDHDYLDTDAAALAQVVGSAAAQGVRFAGYTLARMILDAGYRKTEPDVRPVCMCASRGRRECPRHREE